MITAIVIGITFQTRAKTVADTAVVIQIYVVGTGRRKRKTIPGELIGISSIPSRSEILIGLMGEEKQVVRVSLGAGGWGRKGHLPAEVARSMLVGQALNVAAEADKAGRLAQVNLRRAVRPFAPRPLELAL